MLEAGCKHPPREEVGSRSVQDPSSADAAREVKMRREDIKELVYPDISVVMCTKNKRVDVRDPVWRGVRQSRITQQRTRRTEMEPSAWSSGELLGTRSGRKQRVERRGEEKTKRRLWRAE